MWGSFRLSFSFPSSHSQMITEEAFLSSYDIPLIACCYWVHFAFTCRSLGPVLLKLFQAQLLSLVLTELAGLSHLSEGFSQHRCLSWFWESGQPRAFIIIFRKKLGVRLCPSNSRWHRSSCSLLPLLHFSRIHKSGATYSVSSA